MGFLLEAQQRPPTSFRALQWNGIWVLLTLQQLLSSRVFLPNVVAEEEQKAPHRLHTLFSVECGPYFDWQTVGLMHSLRKAKQPGPITRLLSCADEELKKYKNLDIAPTHVVPSMSVHPVTKDVYPAINKPAGVLHWLTHSEEAKNVDWVVILDADMIMRHPMVPWELGVEKGRPLAAYYGYLIGCESNAELARAHTRYPEFCDKVGGFLLHHIDDLRALAPLWLSKTEEVRADKAHYATKYTGDIYEQGWISEMYGYSFGSAEIGLRHHIDNNIMIYPGYIPLEGVDPLIMHYGIRFNVSSWHFAKSEHTNDPILEDCNRLFPEPPYPEEVQSITRDRGQRGAHYLSIECMNTINEGLLLHHAERRCPEAPRIEYIDFLLTGLAGLNESYDGHLSITLAQVKAKFSEEDVVSLESTTEVQGNDEEGDLRRSHKIHTVFSTECNDYFDWQALGLYHSFLLSGQPGMITRLLSCTDEQLRDYKNMDLAPTHVVPSYSVHPLTGDKYPAINKPVAVYHWLNHIRVDVEYVVILDADMILRRPITPWELGASKGHPVSASYEYLVGCDNELATMHSSHPEYCQKVGGVIVMHIDDLRRLAPIWLHKTEEVRADKAHWATRLTGDIYGNGWISEMYGYSFGAAELKLNHTINKDMMLYPGYIPGEGVEPLVLHYGLEFKIGNWSWDKQTWHYKDMTSTCWTLFPFPPIPDKLLYSAEYEYKRDMLSFECMKTLNEALFLYHKRKGCPPDEQSKQFQILRGQRTMLNGSDTQTKVMSKEHEDGDSSAADAKKSLDISGKQETPTQTVSGKVLMEKVKQPGDKGIPPKFWIVCISWCFGGLVVLATLAFCSKRRRKRRKERMV